MRVFWRRKPTEVACDVLNAGVGEARERLCSFEAEGYVQRVSPDDDWWETTIKGSALAQARFSKPISRATATRLLGEVIERARTYNSDPKRLLTVSRIEVFGSFLDPSADRLGDLDIAVSTVRRETDGRRFIDSVLTYTRESGRRFGTYSERLGWPERELRMFLKNRSTAVSITDEDVSAITNRFEVVYATEDDLGAIAPQPSSRPGN
jgi:predicted nucleotidyltransferase